MKMSATLSLLLLTASLSACVSHPTQPVVTSDEERSAIAQYAPPPTAKPYFEAIPQTAARPPARKNQSATNKTSSSGNVILLHRPHRTYYRAPVVLIR